MSHRFCCTAILCLLSLLGCERDLPYVTPSDQPISGYHLEGYVTDRLGTPVKGLRIALWYDYDFLNDGPPPSQVFVVDDTMKTALVQVLDFNSRVKRLLYQGRSPLGELEVPWDKTDSLDQPVPSGIYTLVFTEGGVFKNSYSVIVDGAVTAMTDSLGHYSIANDSFPVGFSPAPLYSSVNGKFVGNYQITPFIRLEFYLDVHRSATVTMNPDQVTRFDYRI